MSIAAEPQTCLKCGQPLGGLAPAGLCSRCLLLTGFDQTNAATIVHDGSQPRRTDGDPLPRSFGDYELLEEIARGGMGIVYKARQASLDRIVAVKMLLFGQYASEEFVHRFRIEASAAASLQHPNIVAIHEVGVHQGQHYFAMDFVDGQNLTQFVRNQPLPAKRAAGYVKTIAEAIQFAHQRRVLHRDLKPANVMIDSNDQPRITDFGLAKKLAEDSDLTVTGQVLGSPNYMPPEQASAQRGQIGPPSDVYSMGAILYHALTARPPFVGETLADTLQQVLHTEPVAPRLLNPAVPRDLETICLKCLEKETTKRYGTAQELADEVARFLRDEPIHARPVTRTERVWRWCRRNPLMANLGAATVLLLLAVAIGGPVAAVRINSERRRAEQNLYASDMNLAFKALEANNRGRVLALLKKHTPKKASGADWRGWEWRYLWKQTRSDELASLPESKREIQCLTFSPDGKYLATVEGYGLISIWDLATTQRVAQCESALAPCLLQFSSDRHLISGYYKNGLWLWDWNAPHLTSRGPPLGAKGIFNGVDLSGGIVTAVAQDRQALRRWELTTGRELPGFPIASEMKSGAMDSGVAWSVFSSDGHMVATTSNNVVILWNRETGAKLKELLGSDSMVVPLAFSPDGRLIVANGYNGTCDIWETDTFRRVVSFAAHASSVDRGNFSPDGKQFVTAGYDHTVKIWDTSEWRKPTNEWRKTVTLRGHLGEVYDVAFSPDGKLIASASADGTVKFWSASAKPRQENFKLLPPDVSSWSLSPGGRRLFLLFADHTFSLWDLNTGDESHRQPLPSDKTAVAALFADGRRVALGDADGAVQLLDLRTMKAAPMQTSFSNNVIRVSCSADGSTIVAQSTNDAIKAWQVAAGRELATFSAENNALLNRLPISPDGRVVATAPFDGTTEFWELPSLNKRTIASDKLYTSGVAFFRDGRVATSSYDKTAQVWDLNTRRSVRKMYSDQTGLHCIALSPDERRLAAGDDLGSPRKVKIWDIDLEYEVAVLSGHTEPIIDVAFWPDGNTIVSVSKDRVSIWRAASFDDIAAAEKAERPSLRRTDRFQQPK